MHPIIHSQVTSDWVQNRFGRQLESLLILNREINIRYVAMKKILIYHPDVLTDIEHLFEWDSEDERVNVLLPDVIAWYGRAAKAIAEVGSVNKIKERHLLSAVYQFARVVPTLFVPDIVINNHGDEGGVEIDNNNNNNGEGIEVDDGLD